MNQDERVVEIELERLREFVQGLGRQNRETDFIIGSSGDAF